MHYGRYQIIKEIGRGSMGVVFQAHDPQIDRLVAVKVLRTDRMESEEFVQRFLKEAKVIGRLTHRNIIAIHDVGEEQGAVYIAMEFLEGTALSEVVKGKLPNPMAVVALGVQLAETLDYAHKKGVVHRDIKPGNILVQHDGQIKITDFGIAHVDDSISMLQTQAGEIMGTPAYMSPEQVLSRPVDGRSDIFSLGIILYELCTGSRPFGAESKSLITVFNDIVELAPSEPADLVPAAPKELSRVIMKALQKDPAKRFQTGGEFAEALRHCLEVGAPPLEKGPVVSASKCSKRIAAIFCAVAVLAAAAVGFFVYSSQHTDHPASLPVAMPMVSGPSAKTMSSPAKIPAKTAPAESSSNNPKTAHLPPVAPASLEGSRSHAIPAKSHAQVASPAPVSGSNSQKTEGAGIKKAGSKSPAAAALKGGRSPEGQQQKHQRHPLRERHPAVDPVVPSGAARSSSDVPVMTVPQVEAPVSAAKPIARFAFLKVASLPQGARVYINGTHKGMTPVTVKLDFGQYQIRLLKPGYLEVERQISLEKMKEYPMVENLRPIE
jgi:eukaryotic-like serine/threonine-protein kinase